MEPGKHTHPTTPGETEASVLSSHTCQAHPCSQAQHQPLLLRERTLFSGVRTLQGAQAHPSPHALVSLASPKR